MRQQLRRRQKSNETTVDAGKETKPTKPESNETTAVNETTKPNETTVDFNKQTKNIQLHQHRL